MLPDRVSNPEPLALESDALLTALLGSAGLFKISKPNCFIKHKTKAVHSLLCNFVYTAHNY